MSCILEMVNYYSLETLGMVMNPSRKKIKEIITLHEKGLNQHQYDPSSVFSNYVKHDSYTG